MKRLILIGILSSILWEVRSQERMVLKPEAQPVQSSIFRTTPEIIKISWGSTPGMAYIIESQETLGTPWKTFSFEITTNLVTRRSIVTGSNAGFYRVMESAMFPAETTINWCAQFPDLSSNEVSGYSATWMFDDGQTNSSSGDGLFFQQSKTYDSAGLKTASVIVTNSTGTCQTKEWAVAVTNANTNLVLNSDFEQMSNSLPMRWQKGGYGTNNRTHPYPVPGVNGSVNAARVVVSNFVSGDAKWVFDPVPVNGNSTYRFTDWYHSTVPVNITAEYRLTNGGFEYQWLTSPSASASWRQVSADLVTPPTAKSVTIFHALTTNGSLTIDTVSLLKVSSQPISQQGMVSLNFDDGNKDTTLTSSNILQNSGYRGTFYIVTTRVGRPGIVTIQDILNLEKSGHEIGGHSLTHSDLITLDPISVERELNLCRNDLLMWGVKSVTTFAYPFGSYNATVKQLAKEAGYAVACGTGSGLNDRAGLDTYALKRTSIRSSMTVNDVRTMIDNALLEKKWLILTFHHVDSTVSEYSVTPSFLQQVVNYLSSVNAKVVTTKEGHKLLTSP